VFKIKAFMKVWE